VFVLTHAKHLRNAILLTDDRQLRVVAAGVRALGCCIPTGAGGRRSSRWCVRQHVNLRQHSGNICRICSSLSRASTNG
jgi:hypothetical protein